MTDKEFLTDINFYTEKLKAVLHQKAGQEYYKQVDLPDNSIDTEREEKLNYISCVFIKIEEIEKNLTGLFSEPQKETENKVSES